MIVTEEELRLDLPRYLDMAANDDITITRDGGCTLTLTSTYPKGVELTPELIALIQQPKPGPKNVLDSLIGIIPPAMTVEEAREERLSKI